MMYRRLLCVAVMLTACRSVHAEPRERDAWYAFVADGVRCGSLHVEVSRLPDGNYRILRTSRILLDFLGANREAVEGRSEYVVTPSYRPISIESEEAQTSGKVRISGRMRGDAFELTTRRAGVERTTTLPIAAGVLFEACLDDWLADRPPGFTKGEVTFLDEEACEPQTTRVARVEGGGAGSSWEVDSGPMEGDRRVVLGADGLLVESKSGDVGLNLQVCTAEEARNLSYHKMDGRDLLMFPIGKDVGPPERLDSLTVELRWKGIPFDRFRLVDERQRVVEHSEDGDKGRALVCIEAPKPSPDSLPVRLPVEGAEFAPFLAASRYIEPNDPGIVDLARRTVAGKSDALEAVKALADWISRNIEPTMIAETLSGPEVLSCRKGKCSEYATLFASLARAAGIPTRIVLGERMIGGQWGGHMWNEAYVGRWVTVDAGYNEVGASSALLKFVDHETVEGTQTLRRKLPASLEIEIKDFRKKASPLADRFRTGVAGVVYTNADLGCRLAAPGETWALEEKPQGGAAIVRFKVPGRDEAQLHFVGLSLPAGVPPGILLTSRLALYRSKMKGFELISDEKCDVKGSTGRRIEFKHSGADDKPRRSVEVAWRTAASAFLLVIDVDDPAFDESEKAFKAILGSFEDLDTK